MTSDHRALRVNVLGGARLAGAGERFGADKRHQLLAYLACRGDWVSRDELADLFWSKTSTSGAKQNLRRLLGRTNALPWLRGFEIERARVRWRVETDLARFRAALRAEDWEAALASYGGPFLEGLDSYEDSEFADWLTLEREHLHGLWREASFQRAEQLAAEAAWERAIAVIRGVLERDGLDEDAVARALDMAQRGADRRQALTLYRAFTERLQRALGLTPSAALEQLATRVEAPATMRALPPVASTSFVGREAQLAEIASALASPSCRLLTLLGPGGVGKTRIALEAARRLVDRYPDGVTFVALEALTAVHEIPTAIAEALHVPLTGADAPLAQVARGIGDRRLLLVLDNLEHLLGGVGLLTQLTARCPQLQLLVTSRERLKVGDAWTVPLTGLAYPTSEVGLDEAHTFDAVALFVERARRVQPAFALGSDVLEHVVEICRLVDGFPLGIELAAVWVRALRCEDIVAELEKDVDFLSTSAPGGGGRHHSMRAAFEHSWALLTPSERAAFARLAVFRGGFDRAAAAAVADASVALLAALLDKSLLRTAARGRFEIHPLLQQFAAEKLLTDGAASALVRARHATCFLGLADRVEPEWHGSRQEAWLQHLDDEYQNVCAALDWFHDQGDTVSELRLAGALGRYWWIRGHYRAGRGYLERALAGPQARPRAAVRAKALSALALLAWGEAKYGEAQTLLEECLSMHRDLGDEAGVANATHRLGILAHERGDHARATTLYGTALELVQRTGNEVLAASIEVPLGSLALEQGALTAARAHYERALTLYRRHADKLGIANALVGAGLVAVRQGDDARAARCYEECLAIARALGDTGRIGFALRGLGLVTLGRGAFGEAQRYLAESLALSEATGDRRGQGYSLQGLGLVALEQGERGEAQASLEAALALQRVLGDTLGTASSLHALARLAVTRGEVDVAEGLLREGLQLLAAADASVGTAYLLEGFAEVAAARDTYEEALRLWAAAARLREERGAPLAHIDRERRDEALGRVRSRLLPAAAAAAWHEGATAAVGDLVARLARSA